VILEPTDGAAKRGYVLLDLHNTAEAAAEVARQESASEPAGTGAAEACGFRSDLPVYGGQAVIEGVMMRGKRFAATSVRREDGEIIVRTEEISGFVSRHPWINKPLLRGAFTLFDSLLAGYRSLRFSADVLTEEMHQQEKSELDASAVREEPLGDAGVRMVHSETGLSVESVREADLDRNRKRALRMLKGKVARYEALGGAAEPGPSAPTAAAAEPAALTEQPAEQSAASGMPGWSTAVMFLGLTFAVIFVVVVPHLIGKYLSTQAGLEAYAYQAGPVRVNLGSNIIEGLIRLGLFLGYVWVIGFMPDIRRVFQYHGAEHMTVYGVEAGAELTPADVRRFSRLHPRCGTNFIFIVICVKIALFSFLEWDSPMLRIVGRLALLPVVAAVSYEILRLAGRYRSSGLTRALIAPGLWVQRLTTREPDDSQIEVAILSMKRVLDLELAAREPHAG